MNDTQMIEYHYVERTCVTTYLPESYFYYLYQNLNGIMLTYNTILKELKDIPVNRLKNCMILFIL